MRQPAGIAIALLLFGTHALFAQKKDVDFTRDVRPILTGKCLQCHGLDDKVRKAGLRLDVRDGTCVKVLGNGHQAIVPGQIAMSELAKRVTSADPAHQMPPAKFGKPLLPAGNRDAEAAGSSRAGAYAQHWAYVRPVRLAVPRCQ